MAEDETERKLIIYTVNYPLKYFAERIGGDQAAVIFPAPPDVNPAFWIPEPGIILDYQKADLILLNGADYARWLRKATLPRRKCVDTSRAFKGDYISIQDAVTHSHGPNGEHSHAGTASITWIDFSQAAHQARAIMEAQGQKKPAARETFQKNYEALESELFALDREIKQIVSGGKERPLVSSHPVYQYFARRYELNIESVSWESREVPRNELWEELRYGLEAFPARWMIWESDPHPESVRRLASMGVRSLVFDPCENAPGKGDFMSVMRGNIDNLKKAFE
jgi:zinc transport system substrate-binding protein